MLLEDDENLNRGIALKLQKEGYQVFSAFQISEAEKLFDENRIDLVISDITLPDGNGLEFCRKIRNRSKVFVLFLTAMDSEIDMVNGYDAGADDYIVKPFEMLELLVRIEKVLERTGRARKVLTIRNIMVDVQSHQVFKDGIPVNLKPMEYDLFVLLLQNKNIALGREELLKRVWGEDYLGESRTVDVHIGQLRKKLELYDEIRTIPKLGYRLEE